MSEQLPARLLVVDDVQDNREILKRRFERFGYVVQEADGGESALRLIEAQAFDLILLDVVMPDIDGMEVLRRIRTTRGPESLPVIMVTAKTMSEDVVAALDAGANDYLTKPVDMAVAKARVAVQIARKRAEERSRDALGRLEETVALLEVAVRASDAANRAKSEFLANMSHEFRTPLNGVLGMAAVLARSELSAADRRMVQTIGESAAVLDRLVGDVLDMAKLDAGQLGLERAPFHLGELVRSLAAEARPQAERKRLALTLDIATSADQPFHGDAERLAQVLRQLTSNALKFTEAGQITLSAAWSPAAGVEIAVTDTGVGFDAARKAELFARFSQADGTATRRFGGAGLGLSIAKQLAELMGGALDAQSAPGAGSTFWLRLPLDPAARQIVDAA